MNALPFLLALILPVLPSHAPSTASTPASTTPEPSSVSSGTSATSVHDDDADADGDTLVAVSILCDHDAAQPGSTITLGIQARVKPRWHVYWGPNAGDSGLPFKVDVTGPEGWTIGAARFPWPKRDVAEGDIVQYLHEGELLILVDVQVPATAKAGTNATFDVAASWLACTTVCLPGKGKARASILVADASKVANEAAFTAARAKVPRPWSDLGRVMVNASGEGAARKLTIVVPGATALEFFPYTSDTTSFTTRKIDVGKQGGTAVLEYEFKRKKDGDVPIASGVLWVKTDKGETSYELKYTFQP